MWWLISAMLAGRGVRKFFVASKHVSAQAVQLTQLHILLVEWKENCGPAGVYTFSLRSAGNEQSARLPTRPTKLTASLSGCFTLISPSISLLLISCNNCPLSLPPLNSQGPLPACNYQQHWTTKHMGKLHCLQHDGCDIASNGIITTCLTAEAHQARPSAPFAF